MGAVYLQKVVVQHLAGPIFLSPQRLHGPHTTDYALRLFYALRKALQQLRDYYSRLPIRDTYPRARFFPHIRSNGPSGPMKLDYIAPLSDISKAVYLANMDGTKVVVKFASKYNVGAHRLLAKNDLAPELLYDGTDERRYGGLVMLVMEHVEGQTLSEYLHSSHSQEQLEAVIKSVETAVHLLHGQNLVFGDLRTPNILIGDNGRVRFVDFDWCGVHGQDQYPFIIGNGIEWADGVGPLSTMDNAHDLHMLNNLVAHIRAGEVPGTW